eukprot:CAMPEP_0116035888 /NCGR_PEP_ID=MMETSP0321-20121206/20713_1 /TAXON_ID=163516 /ORGANISM="Leptocylindrus danicus var. danicus, Strain B650" /LENGTH=143 /DNA_ID=CAMNT_0003512961 /DNA_START=418 /DNA_END=849 /DNA_ORIENTATION=+
MNQSCSPKRASTSSVAPKSQHMYSRRGMVQLSGWGMLFGTVAVVAPKPANALKDRNEQLCKTGFFTNIAQYYCTDIGNISDEGVSKGPSTEEADKMDSLMSKFDFDGANTSSSSESNAVDDNASGKVASMGGDESSTASMKKR